MPRLPPRNSRPYDQGLLANGPLVSLNKALLGPYFLAVNVALGGPEKVPMM